MLVDPTQVGGQSAGGRGASGAPTQQLRAERDLREQVQRLRAQLTDSARRLHVAPANVRRVVDVALRLAAQPPLADIAEERSGPGECSTSEDPYVPGGRSTPEGSDGFGRLIAPPVLRSGWERTVVDLADPLSGQPRPLTFDPQRAADRDDVVLAHLGILVARSAVLRSAIRSGAPPCAGSPRSAHPCRRYGRGRAADRVFAQLVVVGAGGARLHGGQLTIESCRAASVPSGAVAALELEAPRNAAVRQVVEDALEPRACHPAPAWARARLAGQWEHLHDALAEDVRVRARQRVEQLTRALTRRAEEETRRVNGVFDQLEAMLRGALAGDGVQQLSFDDLLAEERQQWERDRTAWQARLDALPEERRRDLDAVTARYAGLRELVFPFAVALVVPETSDRYGNRDPGPACPVAEPPGTEHETGEAS